MSKMQEEVDERELLGQHGTRMYQVPHQRLPSQAGNASEHRASGDWDSSLVLHIKSLHVFNLCNQIHFFVA